MLIRLEQGRSFSIAGGLERSIMPIDSLASKYLRLNPARLQLVSSHGPTAQLSFWSVQMLVIFVREQPLEARAGAMQGSWEKKMSEEVNEAVSGQSLQRRLVEQPKSKHSRGRLMHLLLRFNRGD